MPHVIEPATSGRARCRGCGQSIARETLRVGERLPNPFADDGGETTHWFHVACAAYRRPEVFLDVVVDRRAEADPDGRLTAEAERGVAHHRLSRVNTAERAPSGRATCRHCRTPIAKEAWRISLVYGEDGRFVPAGFIHARCARAYLGIADVAARLRHFSADLTPVDLEAVLDEIASGPEADPTGTA